MNYLITDCILERRKGSRRKTDDAGLAVWWPTLSVVAVVVFTLGVMVGKFI